MELLKIEGYQFCLLKKTTFQLKKKISCAQFYYNVLTLDIFMIRCKMRSHQIKKLNLPEQF